MRIALAAVVVAATLATPALATPKPRVVSRCTVLTDPAGDVAPAAAVPDHGVDLRSVSVETYDGGLGITIANTAIDQQRHAIWRLTFRSRGTTLFVAAGTGVWANVGDGDTLSGFQAGVVGQRAHAVSGRIDHLAGTVRLTVPFSAFGRAVGRGAVLSSFAIEAKETLLAVAPPVAPAASTEVKFADTAATKATFTVGRTC